MIREKSNGLPLQIEFEDVNINLEIRYNMGTSQKFPVHIPTFLQRNQGDPAVKVSNPSLHYTLFDTCTEFLCEAERSPTSPCPNGTSEGSSILS